jgi:superfamily I DNA/RNA helicase
MPAGPSSGRLLFPYGWGVVLASLRRDDVRGSDFEELFAPARTLLRDDLEDGVDAAAFQRRLWGMFTVSYPHTLTLPQRDRIRWHLFPELRLAPQAELDFGPTETAPALPDLMQVMDLQQEQVARTLGEGHRVIHGAAGSGKTMILIYRAQFLAAAARADQPILVLCYNRTLADRIAHVLRTRGVDERVQVRTFHAWCQDLVRSYQLDVPAALKGDAYFAALADAVERAVDRGRVPGGQYLALLIDEAHDFEDAWLRIAGRMVNPATNSLLVLYDDVQSIYQGDKGKRRRRFNFASVGIEARGRTSILRLNYRNTAEVLALAMQCAQGLLQGDGEPCGEDEMPLVQPATAGRRGPLPVLVQARHAAEEAALLAERVAAALAAGTAPDDIAVLCRTKALMGPIEQALLQRAVPVQAMNALAFRRFDWTRPSAKLLTMHSAKGLEFSLVCVAGLQALPMRDETLEDAVRLLYVAMTRATRELVLSASGDSAVVRQVRAALAAVAQRFSATA